MAPPQLEARLLGRFAVRVAGRDVEVASRSAQTLLAFLLMTPGIKHRRERLAAMLWPDADEERARQNLRNALWKVNKALGDGFVMADKLSVAFDAAAAHTVDVLRFESGDASTPEALSARLDAYGGELLPGFYDEWILLERDRLAAAYEGTAAAALEALAAAARWPEVVACAERWIALGQVPEPAYRALMRAHHALGDAAGVAAAFERCRKDLANGLGVEPSEETEALRVALADRGRAPAPAQPAATGETRPDGGRTVRQPAFLTDAAARRSQMAEPFVGRERELGRLEAALAAVLEGRSQVVLVTGEAGRGKSSLLATFVRVSLDRHPHLVVAAGTCDAFVGPGDPLLPFREVLAVLTGDVEARWRAGTLGTEHALRSWALLPLALEALLARGSDLLDTVLPSAALIERAAAYARSERLPDLEAYVAEAVAAARARGPDRTRLFDAFADVVEALSEHHPLVLMLDDLHWADASSVQLFFHLVRRLQGRPVLLLGAYRPEELLEGHGGAHPLIEHAAEIERRHGDVHIDLDAAGSDPGAARAFVDALIDREPNELGDAFRREVVEHTGGHALFTVELLHDLEERGVLRTDDTGRWRAEGAVDFGALPARVEGVIRARLARLPSDLGRALAVASVEGVTFTAEVVAGIEGLEPRAMVARLAREADRRHRLIRDEGIGRHGGARVSRYRFRHAAFQRHLYQTLGASERAYLHEAVARTLEDVYGDAVVDHAVVSARHLREAGLHHEAAAYLLRAGRRSLELPAYDEAVAQLREGLELLRSGSAAGGPSAGAREHELELPLLLALGTALQAREGYGSDEAGAVFALARAVAERAGDRVRAFQAAWNEWGHHMQHARLERAAGIADELLEVALADDDELRLQAHHAQWFTALSRGRFGDALAHADAGIALYRPERHHHQAHAYGGHDPGVCARLFAARAAWHLGDGERTRAMVEEAEALAARLGHPPTVVHAKVFAAEVRLLQGAAAQARAAAHEARARAHELGLAHWSSWSTVLEGCALAADGELDLGIRTLEEGLDAYAATGGQLERPVFLTRLAEAYALRGDVAAAWRHLTAAAELVERTGEHRCDAVIERLRGELLRRDGRAGEAAEAFARARLRARQQGAVALEAAAAAAAAPGVVADGAT